MKPNTTDIRYAKRTARLQKEEDKKPRGWRMNPADFKRRA